MRISLRLKFLFVSGGITVAALGFALWALSYQLEQQLVQRIAVELEGAQSTFVEWHAASQAHLHSEVSVIADDPRFFAAVAEGDPATAMPIARQFQQLAANDLFLVVTADGSVLAHLDADGAETVVQWPRTMPPSDRSIRIDDKLFILESQAVMLGPDTLGYVALGRCLDSELAASMGRIAGADVFFFENETIFASTLQHHAGPDLIRAIASSDESAAGVTQGTSQLQTGDNRFLFRTGMLPGNTRFRYAILTSLDERLAPSVREVRGTIFWVGLVAFVIAGFVSVRVARRVTARIPRLVDAVEAVARGDYGAAVRHHGHDELSQLAVAVERMRIELAAQMAAIEKANTDKLRADRLAVIGKMASSIIHDFKTPMQVIRTSVEMAAYTTDSPEAQSRYAGMVYHELDRMVAMTQDLLEFARGRARLARTSTDLDQFLHDTVDAWSGIAGKESVSVTLRSEGAVVAAIDPAKIRRALDNVFTNAMEVLGPGGTITVTLSSDSDTACIALTDTGPGIPDEIKDSLFEPFATSGKALGTGLGLAVTRKAIEDHGGTIRASSDPGTGTTFAITLPLGVVATSAEGNATVTTSKDVHHETQSA